MNWEDINKKKPIAVETGNWDGRKSEEILVRDIHGKFYIATMYEGCLDGNLFCDFYDSNDFEIKNITNWCVISFP